MSEGVNAHEYFDVVPHWTGVGGNLNLLPAFEEEVIEDTDEYRIFRASDGVVQKDWKKKSCIPHYIDYTLKTADDWPEYKKRLSPPQTLKAMYAALKIQACPLYSHRLNDGMGSKLDGRRREHSYLIQIVMMIR